MTPPIPIHRQIKTAFCQTIALFRQCVIPTTLAIVAISTLAHIDSASAQVVTPDTDWKTGRKILAANELAVSVSWSNAPIRSRLQSFSGTQKLAFFLDRRIDPSLKINTRIRNGTTEQFLWQLASEQGIGVCRIEDFYYFGPTDTTEKLPLAIEALKQESTTRGKAFRKQWSKRRPIQTTEIIQPKQLLSRLAIENGFSIDNLDALPHDVWSRIALPSTTLEGRVAIVLAGFNKWFVRSEDGTSIEIIDFPRIESMKISIPTSGNARVIVKNLKQQFPDRLLSAKGKTRLNVTGTPAQIATVWQKVVESQPPIRNPTGMTPFSLTVRALRINILEKIVADTDRKLIVPIPAPKTLTEPVDLKVVKVPLSELIDEVLKGTGLKFDMDDDTLTIVNSP